MRDPGAKGAPGAWRGSDLATVHTLGHHFPPRPWPNELIPSREDPGFPVAPFLGHLCGGGRQSGRRAAFKEL